MTLHEWHAKSFMQWLCIAWMSEWRTGAAVRHSVSKHFNWFRHSKIDGLRYDTVVFYYLNLFYDLSLLFFLSWNKLLNILCAFCSFYHASYFFQIQRAPLLPSSFPECRFHFHLSRADTGSLRLLMQQDAVDVETLWSYSHNTVSHWSSVLLPIGQHKQPYTVGSFMCSQKLHVNNQWNGLKIFANFIGILKNIWFKRTCFFCPLLIKKKE